MRRRACFVQNELTKAEAGRSGSEEWLGKARIPRVWPPRAEMGGAPSLVIWRRGALARPCVDGRDVGNRPARVGAGGDG